MARWSQPRKDLSWWISYSWKSVSSDKGGSGTVPKLCICFFKGRTTSSRTIAFQLPRHRKYSQIVTLFSHDSTTEAKVTVSLPCSLSLHVIHQQDAQSSLGAQCRPECAACVEMLINHLLTSPNRMLLTRLLIYCPMALKALSGHFTI